MKIKFPWTITALLLIAAIVYVIRESEKISLLESFIPEKIAIFNNVHMSGTEGSSEAWDIYAKEAWTGRNKTTTTFEYVTKASIYKDGRTLVNDMTARRIRISRNKDIEVFKNADNERPQEGFLKARIDFNAITNRNKQPKFSDMTAEHIKFNPDSKKAVIEGRVRITRDKLTVRSDKIVLDLDKNIGSFEAKSYFDKEGSRITCNKATALFDEDRILMAGGVRVRQKNKLATSEAAELDDVSKTITLNTNVIAVIEKLSNILKEQTVVKYKKDEEKEALQQKTVMSCNRLALYTDKGDCTAYGNVRVTQKDKEARSDEAFYNEKDENIILTGNVYMKQKDDWVSANKVIVSVDKETFEAAGAVETVFKVKKGSKR